jgi:uncharacterized protein YndB with AHSA1/START domain
MAECELTRTLPAPASEVWQALTVPGTLATWFWPHLENAVTVDLRPGGRYRITGPVAGIAVAGEYVEVSPPRRLVFTWQWEGEQDHSRVIVELAPAAGDTRADGGEAPADGTVLRLVHYGIGDPVTCDRLAEGWADCLDRLPAALTG